MKSASIFRPHALVSFSFFALGLVSFVALLGWLALDPALLFGAERSPHALAFAHLAILGWMLPFVFGAAYQLIPVIAETRLRSRVLAHVHFGLHVVAAPRIIAAMAESDFAAAGRWGAVIVAGVFLGVANLLVTAGRRSRRTPGHIGLHFALFWLVATVALGVLLALARVAHVVDVPADRVLRLHASCGLIGFFLGALVSVSFKLVPMFLLSPVRSRVRAWAAIVLINGGLQLLVPGWIGDYSVAVAAGMAAIGAGVLCFVAEIAVLLSRRMRALDWPLRSYLIGVLALVPVIAIAVLGALANAGLPVWAPARPGFVVFVAGVFCVLTPAILGMAGKIMPFLTWQWLYADHVGRARVPLVSELFRPALLRAQCFVTAPAVLFLGAGVAVGSPVWIRVGALGLLLGGACLFANVIYLARHVVRPRLQPLLTPVALTAANRMNVAAAPRFVRT
jgi:hypothetical protein